MIDLVFIAVIALQFLDLYTTAFALRTGRGVEGNPVIAWMMKRMGTIPSLILSKGAVIALAVFIWHEGSIFVMAALGVAYAIIMANNVRVILRSRSR